MAAKPRLLDLFSGAGGSARGYQLAGFHVTGVDLHPQPRYAGDAFILGDALEYAAEHGHKYDAIHASPPCQAHTRASHLRTAQGGTPSHPDLIAPTRAALIASGRPWVIENVDRMNDAIPQGGRTAASLEEAQRAMGIDWMKWEEFTQAIPPAYTALIGKQLINYI